MTVFWGWLCPPVKGKDFRGEGRGLLWVRAKEGVVGRDTGSVGRTILFLIK